MTDRDRTKAAQQTSVSAYDLLPQEDREAIEWVREHGGIAYVKDAWNVRRNLDRQLEKAQAKVERQQRHIEDVQSKLTERNERIAELKSMIDVRERANQQLNDELNAMRQRLMPEGMEWPRFEDGEPVRPGDKLLDKDGEWFGAVSFVFTCDWWSIRGYQTEGFGELSDKTRRMLEGMAYGTRVKRPASKVFDADGVEIRVGDVLYRKSDGHTVKVVEVDEKIFVDADDYVRPGVGYTHRAPVLAADGKPLREGETVWYVPVPDEAIECVVNELPNLNKGEEQVVSTAKDRNLTIVCPSSYLTHECPDSWERLKEDAEGIRRDIAMYLGDYSQSDFEEPGDSVQSRVVDLVRRARALAERGWYWPKYCSHCGAKAADR